MSSKFYCVRDKDEDDENHTAKKAKCQLKLESKVESKISKSFSQLALPVSQLAKLLIHSTLFHPGYCL